MKKLLALVLTAILALTAVSAFADGLVIAVPNDATQKQGRLGHGREPSGNLLYRIPKGRRLLHLSATPFNLCLDSFREEAFHFFVGVGKGKDRRRKLLLSYQVDELFCCYHIFSFCYIVISEFRD